MFVLDGIVMKEVDNNNQINEFLNLLNDVRLGKIPIAVYSKRIRKKNIPSDLEYVYGKNPQLALCLLARCSYITKCWNMQTFRWKNPNNYTCINNDIWLKSSKHKEIRSYKTLKEISFSEHELALIFGILQYYYNQTNNLQIKEILLKLSECSSLKGIIVKRDYL